MKPLIATTLYPPGFSQALREAHHFADHLARIDQINAQMVRLGVCRPPQDMSKFPAPTEQGEARKRWERVA